MERPQVTSFKAWLEALEPRALQVQWIGVDNEPISGPTATCAAKFDAAGESYTVDFYQYEVSSAEVIGKEGQELHGVDIQFGTKRSGVFMTHVGRPFDALSAVFSAIKLYTEAQRPEFVTYEAGDPKRAVAYERFFQRLGSYKRSGFSSTYWVRSDVMAAHSVTPANSMVRSLRSAISRGHQLRRQLKAV